MFRSWEENRNKCNHRHGETHHQGFRQSYVSMTARAPSAARTRPPGASAARSARPPRLRVLGSRRAATGRWRQAEAVSSERWTMHHWIPRMLSRKERASWRSWLGGSAVPGQRQAWVGAQGVSRQDLDKDRCGHVTAQAGAAMQLPVRARRPPRQHGLGTPADSCALTAGVPGAGSRPRSPVAKVYTGALDARLCIMA